MDFKTSNKTTGANAGGAPDLPIRAPRAARIAQFLRWATRMITCLIILVVGGAGLLYANGRLVKVLILLAVLLMQFAWFAWPRFSLHGSVIEEPYRNRERMEAHRAWMEQPSVSTEAAYKLEDERLYAHLGRRSLAGVIGVLVLDGAGLFYLWNYRKWTSAQLGASPNGVPAGRLGNSGLTEGPPSVS
jgi:hypothetical protein